MNEITTRILKGLLLVFAVVMVFSIVYHLMFQSYETENAVYYEVSDVSAFQGVYIRNESVARFDGTGAVRYCVGDGAKLGVGSVIAEIYSDEEQIDLRRRIAAKEDELALLTKIENPGTSAHAQPVSLAAQISECYRGLVRARESGDFSALSGQKQEMTVLMSTYDKITRPSVDFNGRIAALNDEIDGLKSRLTDPVQTITSPQSAYFVSYADGYEDVLKPADMARLTPERLSEITDENKPEAAGGTVIGKLIDGYSWYIAGVFDNSTLKLAEGNTASVRLASLNRNLTVTAESLVSVTVNGEKKTQGVFRCDQLTHDVVQHRTERVEILHRTVQGIKVPRSAIRFKELTETVKNEDGSESEVTTNYMGVYVRIGETAEFRKLDIIYEDDPRFYLSSLNAGSGYVALYDDIIVKGVMSDGE